MTTVENMTKEELLDRLAIVQSGFAKYKEMIDYSLNQKDEMIKTLIECAERQRVEISELKGDVSDKETEQ
jgi:hypothetical protein